MKVIWTELAKLQLKEAHQYYKEVAGIKVADSIKKKIFEDKPTRQASGNRPTRIEYGSCIFGLPISGIRQLQNYLSI